ncbi:MAG: ECF transporter S component [Candidatus Verstraetearchaeota archaeon]|jgi:uncharacterized membrane protein|nr:ECF transporter S component [Candidatus Verstraetearchaeota archaeon]
MSENIKRRAKILTEIALFSAISGIGAMIPIPSPIGSIALDSFPGYFMALWRGKIEGALVCAIGHLLSAIRAGFPLGLLHIAIALLMAIVGLTIAIIKNKYGITMGLIGGIILNTIGVIIVVPVLGWGAIIVITPILFLASLINAIIAGIIYKILVKIYVK